MQLRFVTLRQVTSTLCCFTLCSNIVETEVNGDLKSTNERGLGLFARIFVTVQELFCFCLAALVSSVQKKCPYIISIPLSLLAIVQQAGQAAVLLLAFETSSEKIGTIMCSCLWL